MYTLIVEVEPELSNIQVMYYLDCVSYAVFFGRRSNIHSIFTPKLSHYVRDTAKVFDHTPLYDPFLGVPLQVELDDFLIN